MWSTKHLETLSWATPVGKLKASIVTLSFGNYSLSLFS